MPPLQRLKALVALLSVAQQNHAPTACDRDINFGPRGQPNLFLVSSVGLLLEMLRGDNIEEGHYVERLWAALLSPPVDASTGAAALSHANGRFWQRRMSVDMPGLIVRGCSGQHEGAAGAPGRVGK